MPQVSCGGCREVALEHGAVERSAQFDAADAADRHGPRTGTDGGGGMGTRLPAWTGTKSGGAIAACSRPAPILAAGVLNSRPNCGGRRSSGSGSSSSSCVMCAHAVNMGRDDADSVWLSRLRPRPPPPTVPALNQSFDIKSDCRSSGLRQ